MSEARTTPAPSAASTCGKVPAGGIVELSESRAKIDAIDREIVRLFEERMRVSHDVACYKRATGKPVLDPVREAQKIAAATSLADDDFKQFIPPLFGLIMEMSRTYQHHSIDGPTSLSDFVAHISKGATLPESPKVACQGVAGAYSHIASKTLFSQAKIEFVSTWPEVCDLVEQEEVEFGILPLENSTAGTVDRVYDLLSTRGLYIVKAVTLRIDHNLLAKPGCLLEDVREVFSHEQALRQCDEFISSLSSEVHATVCKNTALAAQAVAASERFDVAAISSKECAEIYGLDVLRESVQDERNNFTRFVCVSNRPFVSSDADRSSFLLVLPHEPGSLYRVLSRIAALGVNMVKLESRPIPGREFEFMFYVDVESVPGDAAFDQLAMQIPPLCDRCCYLGSYAEISR